MEFETQPSNASPPCSYVTAPTSPNEHNSLEFYYSAPASPRRKPENAPIETNLDDFEFETSKKFSDHLQFDPKTDHFGKTDHFDCPLVDDDQGQERKNTFRDRLNLLPAMSFADELFFNGLVMPLKLPPRLQYDTDSNSFSHKSPVSSPRTVCKIPFARKNSWNDDFDPFMVALQKVREEKRGRNGHHRRSRSYSPFRALSKCSSSDYTNNENSPIEPMQVKAQGFSGPLDFKGSAYARWVRDQTREGLSPKSPKRFLFGQKVRPLRNDQDGPGQPKEKYVRKKSGDVEESSKVKKLKGFLLRYVSFGSKKTKTSSEIRKPGYYSRLSFKFKENGHRKMAVVEYKPSVALCLGYGVGSPK